MSIRCALSTASLKRLGINVANAGTIQAYFDRTEDMTLIERLEALTGPNFEIEQEIGRLMNSNATRLSVFPAYTASIDAAMTLVPEGYATNMGNDLENWCNLWLDTTGYDGNPIKGSGANLAIALCIAALKATQ